MRFLIFDSNRVYAKKVQALIEEHIKDAEVELAHNIPVLRQRLDGARYDLILADVDTTLDTAAALKELNLVAKKSMVVVWSAVRTPVTKTQVSPRCDAAMVLPKAFEPKAIQVALDKVIHARCAV